MTAYVPTTSQTLMTGVYRCGTEFFTMLMSGHPDLSSTMYHVNLMRWGWGRYDPIDDPVNLCRCIDDLADRIRDRYKIDLPRAEAVALCRSAGQISYGVVYDVCMQLLWCQDGKRHWAEKNQLVWREIPDFMAMMPNPRAIMVIRDPRSVLASTRKWTIAPEPAYLGAVFNCFDAMRSAIHYTEIYGPDRFLVVRYEDIARNPEAGARRVCGFLGLDPDRYVYDPASWQGAYGEQWKMNTTFQGKDHAFEVEAAINRWTQLPEAEIALAEWICAEGMAHFGYASSGAVLDWPAVLGKILSDQRLSDWLRDFLVEGKGVQEFPLDPLKRENWSEGKLPKEKA